MTRNRLILVNIIVKFLMFAAYINAFEENNLIFIHWIFQEYKFRFRLKTNISVSMFFNFYLLQQTNHRYRNYTSFLLPITHTLFNSRYLSHQRISDIIVNIILSAPELHRFFFSFAILFFLFSSNYSFLMQTRGDEKYQTVIFYNYNPLFTMKLYFVYNY